VRSSAQRLILLDVNALLALAWDHHPFHQEVVRRLANHQGTWATCIITQLGFVRLSCNPAIVQLQLSPAAALDVLLRLTRDRHHRFLDSPLGLSTETLAGAVGHRQVTDFYLAHLARQHSARLLTFDRALAASAADVCELASVS